MKFRAGGRLPMGQNPSNPLIRWCVCSALVMLAVSIGTLDLPGVASAAITTEYYPSGAVLSVAEETEDGFGEDVADGWTAVYYESGELASMQYFELGVANGEYFSWYEDGTPSSEATFVGGQLAGPVVAWHENGLLKSEATYTAGIRVGESATYHENGTLESLALYENGAPQGEEVLFFDPQGNDLGLP